MGDRVNLSHLTYPQTLNIGKILTKNGQNQGRIMTNRTQFVYMATFYTNALIFKDSNLKFEVNGPFPPNFLDE